jgi:hypothetical protein
MESSLTKNSQSDQVIVTSVKGLGEALTHFPIKKVALKYWGGKLVGGLLLFSAILGTLILVLDSIYKIQIHNRAIILNQLPNFSLMLGILAPTGILLLFLSKKTSLLGLTTYQKGLVFYSRKMTLILPYSTVKIFDTRIINVLFGSSPISERIKINLIDQANKQWHIPDKFENRRTLIKQIREGLLPILFQKSITKLSEGEMLPFGQQIFVNSNGITIGEKTVFWENLSGYNLTNRHLKLINLKEAEEILKTEIQNIQNLDLLITIIDNSLAKRNQSLPR